MYDAPCIKCERKGCGTYHDQCPEYIAYKNELKKLYEARKKEQDMMARPFRKDIPQALPKSITRTHRHRS